MTWTQTLMSYLPEEPRKRQLTVTGGIIALAAVLSAGIFATGPNAAPLEATERAWPVSVIVAEPSRQAPTFSAFGRLESHRIAHLRSDLIAPVADVLVREGEWVSRGDVLVRLDDREFHLKVLEQKAELMQASANLTSAETQLELEQQNAQHFQSRHQVAQNKLQRHQDLYEKRLISKSLLDEVISQANQTSIEYQNHRRVLTNLPNQIAALNANVARAEALHAQAQLDLEQTVITAPFDGPILGVHAAPGDHTNLSVPLVDIAAADATEVRVQVPDDHVARFREALAAGLGISAASEHGQLSLSRIAAQVRQGQTGTDAFFTFAGDRLMHYSIGRVIDLEVTLPAEADLVALPVQAIYDSRKVFKVVESRLVSVEVDRIGAYEDDHGYRVLVRNPDLHAGDQIITTQLPRAIDGLLVDVANPSSDSH